jgi:hypothetical protein
VPQRSHTAGGMVLTIALTIMTGTTDIGITANIIRIAKWY